MINTTLCYIEQNDCYLMLHRIRKKNDLNEGKWIGVGGHVEPGETVDECVIREAFEETGLHITPRLRGVIEFRSARWEDEHMYLYTADMISGTITACDEGVLEWVPKAKIFDLPLWEGDKVFLNYLLEDREFFHLELRYDKTDTLVSARLLPSLILASASPRRYELLSQIGLEPVILPSAVEEHPEGSTPAEIVKKLSSDKAEDVAARFHNGEIVLGSDTVVVCDGCILGKPASHEEAFSMVSQLQGRSHDVYTAVTLIKCEDIKKGTARKKTSFADKTEVSVYPMTEEEILLYSESNEPMDKAGAYGIQGTFAAYIRGINGDYTTVVGLPLGRLVQELKAFDPVWPSSSAEVPVPEDPSIS